MATVLIAGCGDIGCQLGQQLVENGHTVYAIRRDCAQVPSSIHAIQHDLTQPIPPLPNPIDYVFYTASAGAYKDIAYYQAYVLGVKHVLQAVKNLPLKRLFFISSTSVFGQQEGEWVTEESPTSDHNFSAKRLLEGEQLALQSGLPATVIRFGGIYGPGRTHLIDLVLSGKAHCMEGIYSNRIHSADAVALLKHLLTLIETGQPIDELYIGVDDAPTPICDIYDWLAEQLNVADLVHQDPTETSRQQRGNKCLSNAKIKQTGFQFQYPNYQAGYRSLLEKIVSSYQQNSH